MLTFGKVRLNHYLKSENNNLKLILIWRTNKDKSNVQYFSKKEKLKEKK